MDYEAILKDAGHKRVGLKNRPNTFRSFEDEINKQYSDDLQLTEPIGRESKRAGVLGYKMGMTHFWDRWGVHVPCTVI